MKPLVLINFKTYAEVAGKKSLVLARKLAKVSSPYHLAIAPPTLQLKETVDQVSLPVYAQHVDGENYGAHTGKILPLELKKIGITGTLINHSEDRVSYSEIKRTVLACAAAQLQTIVCAGTLREMKRFARLHPTFLAYEPKQLIGGNISVTDVRPKVISVAVKMVKKISPQPKVLCGAGVHSRKDIQRALQLGADGVLLAHAVVKARDVRAFFKE